MWINILLVIVTLIFLIVLLIKRFLYFRPSFEYMAPRDAFQDIQEGNIHAWYKSGTSGKVILFCHGNFGNLTQRQEKLMKLSENSNSVLIFDYSGFGQSKGIPSEQLCYSNASMFVELLLRKGYLKENIIVYGESLGGAVAAHVARKYGLEKIILESTFTSMKDIVKKKLFFFSVFFPEFPTDEFLTGYKGKILVLHSVEDEIIPYNSMGKIISLATKHFPMTGSHNNPVIPWEEVRKFVA
jgi:pimeloyl-ACP methyl ester carboxylesterase